MVLVLAWLRVGECDVAGEWVTLWARFRIPFFSGGRPRGPIDRAEVERLEFVDGLDVAVYRGERVLMTTVGAALLYWGSSILVVDWRAISWRWHPVTGGNSTPMVGPTRCLK